MNAELQELQARWHDLRAHIDQLAGERQQYVDFFECSPEAYVVTDAQGTICELNGAATDILQRRKTQLRGKPLVAFVALERRREFRARLMNHAMGSQGAEPALRTIIVAAGTRAEVTLHARAIARDGAIGGICWRLEPGP
jgi:PAS domain S-box-containing protein